MVTQASCGVPGDPGRAGEGRPEGASGGPGRAGGSRTEGASRWLQWVGSYKLRVAALVVIACLLALQYCISGFHTFSILPSSWNHSWARRHRMFRHSTKKKRKGFSNWVMPFEEANETRKRLAHLALGAPPYCPVIPPGLKGVIGYNETVGSYQEVEMAHTEVNLGGKWRPLNCSSHHKVALIIPYRDREQHLLVFLHHMHPFLQSQLLDYGIYVVEQALPTQFNRATLFNIGFEKAREEYDWGCYIFHDVDLLPLHDHNLYTCPPTPRHMSVAINKCKKLQYDTIVGGVLAVQKDQVERLNGFSNMFFGWGGEDDDFYNRMKHHNLTLRRYPESISKYHMSQHVKAKGSPDRYKYLRTGKTRFDIDGLNSLDYKLLDYKKRKLFTWIYVEVDQEKVLSKNMTK